LQLLPGPVVHADFAAAASLAAAHQHGAAARVEIGLGERERFADPQPGAPQQDDQAAQALPVDRLAGGAHDGDDLLHGGWVVRVAHSLVTGRATGVEARQRGGRAATTGASSRRSGIGPPSDSDVVAEDGWLDRRAPGFQPAAGRARRHSCPRRP
jgi:hypothetical protein